MLIGPLQNLKKPAFSGHETFPMRYGWLTKMMDYFNPDQSINILIEKSKKFSRNQSGDKASDLMADFGVGRNMVLSMKFWANRSGIINTDTKMILTLIICLLFGLFIGICALIQNI